MLTKTTRESSRPSARAQTREVFTSTPMTPLTTTIAPSTTRSAAAVSAWNPASPGASITLILRSCQSRWQTDDVSDIRRRCSSSSQSATVEPCSIDPSRLSAPAWNSNASVSVVFPVPRWPTTATLRILAGSTAAMEGSSSDAWPVVDTVILALSRRALRPVAVTTPAALGAEQSRPEPHRRLRVQLRHARLRDAEDLADLAQRQLLVVVQRDH